MNSAIAIKAENVGKKYTLHHGGRKTYSSLRETVSANARKLLSTKSASLPSEEEFWALKNINFEIPAGDSVGIIGRNGAGKSTLLKILSRITEPTEGRIIANGRVASLLEVGTGFHQELTGRENIFLNGAILGMSKTEIRKRFDEIVGFSGVEKFLDTPVKHYSTGMSLRLAFAVSAHLDQDILLVDEVLAVGDSEFQKKCLGKMDQVSRNQGRTVLFVSHDLGSIGQLCRHAILLDNGRILQHDIADKVINSYISLQPRGQGYNCEDGKKQKFIRHMTLQNSEGKESYSFGAEEPIQICFSIFLDKWIAGLYLAFAIQNRFNKRLCLDYIEITRENFVEGRDLNVIVNIPGGFLAPGSFSWDISIITPGIETYDSPFGVCPFEILDNNSRLTPFSRTDYGDIRLKTTHRFEA